MTCASSLVTGPLWIVQILDGTYQIWLIYSLQMMASSVHDFAPSHKSPSLLLLLLLLLSLSLDLSLDKVVANPRSVRTMTCISLGGMGALSDRLQSCPWL